MAELEEMAPMTIELEEEVEDVQLEPKRILFGETTVEEQLAPIATDPVAPAVLERPIATPFGLLIHLEKLPIATPESESTQYETKPAEVEYGEF